VRQLLEHMTAQVAGQPLHAAVLHAAVPDEAEALRQEICRRFSCVELYVTDFTPVMGTHTGPGVLGVAYYCE
jgi:fatty acid-binding protein DegV